MTPPDDLDRLFRPSANVPAGADFRAAVLRSTTRVLRRRMWFRRVNVAAGVLVVFTLGVGTGRWLTPVEREVVYVTQPEPERPTPAPEIPRPRSAGELEQLAELSDDRAEVAWLYREAGDQYLTAEKDYAEAARCYRLHLQAADPEARKIAASDSWLLMTMKAPQ